MLIIISFGILINQYVKHMRNLVLLIAFLLSSVAGVQAQAWKPAGDKIKTPWAEKLDPSNLLPEYPRPLVERTDWQNLNGLWDYAILPKGAALPSKFDGKILVP